MQESRAGALTWLKALADAELPVVGQCSCTWCKGEGLHSQEGGRALDEEGNNMTCRRCGARFHTKSGNTLCPSEPEKGVVGCRGKQ